MACSPGPSTVPTTGRGVDTFTYHWELLLASTLRDMGIRAWLLWSPPSSASTLPHLESWPHLLFPGAVTP